MKSVYTWRKSEAFHFKQKGEFIEIKDNRMRLWESFQNCTPCRIKKSDRSLGYWLPLFTPQRGSNFHDIEWNLEVLQAMNRKRKLAQKIALTASSSGITSGFWWEKYSRKWVQLSDSDTVLRRTT